MLIMTMVMIIIMNPKIVLCSDLLKGSCPLSCCPIPRQIYNPGEHLILGGPGLANIMDELYLVAFQNERVSSTAREGAMSILPRSLRTGDLRDYSFWLQQLVKSVKRNRMTEVMIIVETGGHSLERPV